MINGKRVAVVLPAYNAASTLEKTLAELDRNVIDDIILVDDCSSDETVELARQLGLDPIRHDKNKGYGANQKTCYRSALSRNADIVVMLHPDYQYSPKLTAPMAAMIAYGEYDAVLGSRILAQKTIEAGMPVYKYVANRALTFIENLMVGAKLSEYHTGLRAFACDALRAVPFELNSDDFVFDNELIIQLLAAGARVGELSCPTRYEPDSSSINFQRSVKYGFGVLRTSAQYRLRKLGSSRFAYLDVKKIEHA
jgi:glycosyltransferase involved in cell wall biosynthesis